ncbi:MAG: chromate transporter [Capsulimonadaceae bacterium]|nr:chromate transporter [Capsulimonadaceae bacterium]
MTDPVYFLTFLKASLLSSGGAGNLPILHADLTSNRVATSGQFAEALAIGQISPGPSGLWTVSLGYLTRGLPGSILAAVGITLPPFTILALRHAYGTVRDHPVALAFMRGLNFALAGVSIVVLIAVLRSAGINSTSILIATAAGGLGLVKRIPVLGIFAAAALAAVVMAR